MQTLRSRPTLRARPRGNLLKLRAQRNENFVGATDVTNVGRPSSRQAMIGRSNFRIKQFMR